MIWREGISEGKKSPAKKHRDKQVIDGQADDADALVRQIKEERYGKETAKFTEPKEPPLRTFSEGAALFI